MYFRSREPLSPAGQYSGPTFQSKPQAVTSEKVRCLITQDCPCHLQGDGLSLAKRWQRVFQGLLGAVFLCYGGPGVHNCRMAFT